MERKEELQLRSQLLNERMMKCRAQSKLIDVEFDRSMQELQSVNAELASLKQKMAEPVEEDGISVEAQDEPVG